MRVPVGEHGRLRPLIWASLTGKRRFWILEVSEDGLGIYADQPIPAGISACTLVALPAGQQGEPRYQQGAR